MSQAVEVGRSAGDILEDILRSRTIRIILIIIAVIIAVLGYITYQPESKPGVFGKIWMALESYWYGFDVITQQFIEDEGLSKLIAFAVRTGFTSILVLSLMKPFFEKENILKIITYIILIGALIIVVYVALSIMFPVIKPIGEIIMGWLKNV